jgi:diadenosine tetraphosphate (Ap4A) HIT family hydrolase
MSSKPHPALEAFQEKFRTRELLVREFEHWLWSVRPVQATLGAGILSLKRYAEKFSDVSEGETAELAKVGAIIEKTLGEAFHYDKINYLMLMMVDPHVHFHVVPRYASGRSFAGQEWRDPGWPALPHLAGEPADGETLRAVVERLKSAQ